jgi:hypothetical protein
MTTKMTTNMTTKMTTKMSAAEEPPPDMDVLRNELARRIAMLKSNQKRSWRSCKERLCRRARGCKAPQIHCTNAGPSAPVSPERLARTMALVRRTLDARAAEIEAQRLAGEGR